MQTTETHPTTNTTTAIDNTVNLLLLGISESGKSTLFKQVKILRQQGYTKEELQSFKKQIQDNLVLGMATLIDTAQKNSTDFTEALEKLAPLITTVLDKTNGNSEEEQALGYSENKKEALKALWKDEAIRRVYEGRYVNYNLLDNYDYFIDDIDRITDKSYIPTVEDVLKCRVRTTGVHETRFEFGGFNMRIVDVGGQRGQRKKYKHIYNIFNNVTALIFVVSLTEYAQVLEEDNTQNRIQESLVLFDELVNSSVFNEKPVLLFLNKVDLFENLIKKVDLNTCFKDYNGPKNDKDAALQFIEKKFKALRENSDSEVYTHVTCAVDTNNISKVLDSLKNIIIKESLSSK
ncbi:hypothetical protein ABK040_005156 [Willaertia magna]